MKKVVILLLTILPISLSSCFAIDSSNTSSTNTSTSSSTYVGPTWTSGDDYQEEDNTIIDTFTLDKRELELKVNKTYSFIVNYSAKSGYSKDDIEFPFKWTSSNESVASVSQYGVCSAKAYGQTKITCESLDGYRRASCTVYVYENEEQITKRWQKVTELSELDSGDLVIMGCPEKGLAASKETTGMYLHSTVADYSSNYSEIVNPKYAEQFMLDYNDGWTFENSDGKYLATTHTGKVTFILKTGNIKWSLDYNDGYLDMRSTSNIDGWFMYNAQADKFTTYESDVQVDMFLVTLYKQVRIIS